MWKVQWGIDVPQSPSLLLFQGMCRTCLCRGLTALGSQGTFIHRYKTWSGMHCSTRAQGSQQEGEQTVLGLGFVSPWSIPCGVNGNFLPLSFPLCKHQPEHLMEGILLPIPSGFVSS